MKMRKFSLGAVLVAVLALTLAACGGGGSSGQAGNGNGGGSSGGGTGGGTGTGTGTGTGSGSGTGTTTLSLAAQVGQKAFFDQSLSGGRNMSCSSCHSPQYAYGPPNSLAVQLGSDPTTAGVRATPSIRYKDATPPYADSAANPDGVTLPAAGGGFMWDGRAATLAAQAALPLLNPIEMNAASRPSVVAAVQGGAYVDLFKQAFGANVFDNADTAFADLGLAVQAYETEDISFHPYTSKFDLYVHNKIGGTMSAAEARGFAVYNDPDKGNCFACHYNGAGLFGSVALFTDFTYAAIGVPRNAAIPANRNARYADLGLCSRPDHAGKANEQYCGEFKTPTLRNVATRSVFFHNGQVKSLAEAIRFYDTRDTDPARWYPKVGGVVRKYDDLPRRYRGNIDTQKPLDGRARGSAPPMTEQEMADLEAFLEMLTDQDVVALLPPHATSTQTATAAK